ncbi:unnamed protein product [Linum trigynum]|uniref:Uncharacterized protein n=1 Tax=Linum trigynum TaxID=586398 RepID=A0AAV2D968_9ROSI
MSRSRNTQTENRGRKETTPLPPSSWQPTKTRLLPSFQKKNHIGMQNNKDPACWWDVAIDPEQTTISLLACETGQLLSAAAPFACAVGMVESKLYAFGRQQNSLRPETCSSVISAALLILITISTIGGYPAAISHRIKPAPVLIPYQNKKIFVIPTCADVSYHYGW